MWKLGIIGGSGLYDLPGLDAPNLIETPWGESVAVVEGAIAGVEIVFLPRHGAGHIHAPNTINYRAHIDALKRAGVTDIVALSACGSLREDLPPGAFVLVDQYIDRTIHREKSFFGEGCVAHVSMADPTCPRLSALAANAAEKAGARVTRGGTYLAMEGPQFSSRAESRLYRSWGCDVIGMTGMPEAKLAREAELPYASVAMVTDYDCWREGEEASVTEIVAVLQENAGKARATIAALAEILARTGRTPSPIDTCLDHALITPPAARDGEVLAKLDAVAGRVLG